MSTYGIWDMKEACWLGKEIGPFVFEKSLAKLAGRIMDARCETRGRFVARPIKAERFHLVDKLSPPVSFADAVEQLKKDYA